ncbi:MAG: hypothetical protein QM488_16965 [Rhizobiaceae bacterium]
MFTLQVIAALQHDLDTIYHYVNAIGKVNKYLHGSHALARLVAHIHEMNDFVDKRTGLVTSKFETNEALS